MSNRTGEVSAANKIGTTTERAFAYDRAGNLIAETAGGGGTGATGTVREYIWLLTLPPGMPSI